MGAVTWRAVGHAFPGPVGLAGWIAATVPAPLVFFEATHRWEEDQPASTSFWWTLGALPVLTAVAAARWTGNAGRQRRLSGLAAAVVVASLVGTVFVLASVAVHRFVIPLDGAIEWRLVRSGVPPLAVAGAVVGWLLALRDRDGSRARMAARHGLAIGAAAAVLGAVLAPATVRLGAEDSTGQYDMTEYGGVGPYAAGGREPGELSLPAADRYAIMAMGFAPQNPECRVAGGAGQPERPADRVAIPPADYGGDFATYAWVATFTVPDPGTYSLTCRSSDHQASYVVTRIPPIRGAVGEMIHWPEAVISALGTVPGLLIIADAVRRRARRR
ncbi:hypothetical protein [Plantactinospora sp. GCM10030261]|uniref:hypothetical protein n=1 Tax=Plantactinospora sp. GCM10030261 TaxID=3273420 RepID=UPI003616C6CE